ncbi:MAG: hypothetical protein NZM11_06855 [Anaerolineales bacterium]|nr:hypothetical protein [Anaerolineales bacterium]
MHKADVETLVAHNFWADNEILSACERISDEEFTRQATPDLGWHSLKGYAGAPAGYRVWLARRPARFA